jgi:Zn-dependent M28 family amino/carboxypeptidase
VPASAIVADVNLDMPLLTYNFSSVIAFGAEHSSLKDNVARAAKQLNVSLMKDPWPEQVAFVRSDHYNFVKQGIPAISLGTGTTSFNKNEDGAKKWEDFEEHHYHQPSDDMSLPFNYDAAARFIQLNFNIALDVANAKERPTWNKGDFFGDTFKK